VLLKDTSLISVIGLEELMRKSQVAVSFTKEPFTFYVAAAVIYLAMTAISMAGIQLLEKRANRGIRREGVA
jgi:polar amino acid transport system permease protein